MRDCSAWAPLSLLTKVFLLAVLTLPLVYSHDAYRSIETRREVVTTLEQAMVIRNQLDQQILAGMAVSNIQLTEFADRVAMSVDPLNAVMTLTFLSPAVDGGLKTLIWIPVSIADDGTHSLLRAGLVPKRIWWVCLSSLSIQNKNEVWFGYRGTLNSKFAPVECR